MRHYRLSWARKIHRSMSSEKRSMLFCGICDSCWLLELCFKGILTKSGYITKIKKNNWRLYTNNNSYIMPNLLKLKKIKCNQDILVQSWRLILSNSNWNCDVSRSTNESTRNWPITEWIHCDELLYNSSCQSSTDWPNFFSQSQWQTETGQSKAKYKQHH